MKFKGSVLLNLLAAALSVGVLASCGGATQVEAFQPKRIIAFGDEYSVIDDSASAHNGSKYTVNGIKYQADGTTPTTTPPTLACGVNPLWIQVLAGSFGLQFNECLGEGVTASQPSRIKAVAGARVADLAAQIKSFTDSESFDERDLSTLLIGTNDIIDIYNSSLADPTLSRQSLLDTATAVGDAAGDQVVRLTDMGTKVVVSTVPNLASSPFAVAEEIARPGAAKLLSDISENYNAGLRLKIDKVRNGGRSVGLVLADDMLRLLVLYPSTYGLDVTTGLALNSGSCTVTDLRQCTPLTLKTGATPTSWLWVDDTHVGPNAQGRIGDLAVTRAHNNPF